jgi:hypothetical protein
MNDNENSCPMIAVRLHISVKPFRGPASRLLSRKLHWPTVPPVGSVLVIGAHDHEVSRVAFYQGGDVVLFINHECSEGEAVEDAVRGLLVDGWEG